ncbi:MAG: hypothetical protein HXX10_08880 [Rhodoplanes sp.]|uniref:hypothetical protein n=1 Tax=Rhodoplanes sp. TaxID=1968906 RepID=UPI0017B22DBD|nr:hypothetical protein [Rhodoplanes sp.]NVO14135.1 hypothetical protein [Rhodoplanes sp.]
MASAYIIRATTEARVAGVVARDRFSCGINDQSERYDTADAALMAARAAYKGPDPAGVACRVWAERLAAARPAGQDRDVGGESGFGLSPL